MKGRLVGAPWRISLGNERAYERSIVDAISITAAGKNKKLLETLWSFIQRDGIVVSEVMDMAWTNDVLKTFQAPYPLEAYVTECAGYIQGLEEGERGDALDSLGKVSEALKKLCMVSLDWPKTGALVVDFAMGKREHMEGGGGAEHGFELALSIWKGHGHTVEQLFGEGRWPFDVWDALSQAPLSQEEMESIRQRLSQVFPSLDWEDLDELRHCRTEAFQGLLNSDRVWAQNLMRGGCQKVLQRGACEGYELEMIELVVDVAVQYGVRLADGLIKKTAARIRNLSEWSRTQREYMLDSILALAQHPSGVALWELGKSRESLGGVARYLPLDRVSEVLEEHCGGSAVKRLAKRTDVASDLVLATRCAELSKGCVGDLLRSGSAEVQRHLIESGKYAEALIGVVKKQPAVIREGVKVPSSIVAKALATGSVSQKQGMLGHLGRWCR